MLKLTFFSMNYSRNTDTGDFDCTFQPSLCNRLWLNVTYCIDFEKERTGHGISKLTYYGLFRPTSTLPRHITYDPVNQFRKSLRFLVKYNKHSNFWCQINFPKGIIKKCNFYQVRQGRTWSRSYKSTFQELFDNF
jgi:hypothetical protein